MPAAEDEAVTRRAQHRGNRPAALFTFADPEHGEVEPEEVRDNPLTRPCPTCGAPVASPCTAGSRYTGRRRIGDYHGARKTPAASEPSVPREAEPRRVWSCHDCGAHWVDAQSLVDDDYATRRDRAAAEDPALADDVERREPDQITCCPLCGGYL